MSIIVHHTFLIGSPIVVGTINGFIANVFATKLQAYKNQK